MFEYLKNWYRSAFADPRAATLSVVLVLASVLIWLMTVWLKPVLVAVILAYLLDDVVVRIEQRNVRRGPAVLLVFTGFVALGVLLLLELAPLLTGQAADLLRATPDKLSLIQDRLLKLGQIYPAIINPEHIQAMIDQATEELAAFGQQALTSSLSLLPWLIAVVMYFVLVPLLLFFFLKDKEKIIAWMKRLLPNERSLAKDVWLEIDDQIGNYIRGKIVHIVIVGAATFIVFWWWDLNYAALLGLAVGLSVLIPYIGAILVTIPVAMVAYGQFGLTPEFWWLALAYMIVQGLDANILVPLLFARTVDLHPVAIVVAVLFFGSLWGFWGVFFAIPLATTFRAIFAAWPQGAPPAETNAPKQ